MESNISSQRPIRRSYLKRFKDTSLLSMEVNQAELTTLQKKRKRPRTSFLLSDSQKQRISININSRKQQKKKKKKENLSFHCFIIESKKMEFVCKSGSIEEYKITSNGMRVLLHEETSAPVAVAMVLL